MLATGRDYQKVKSEVEYFLHNYTIIGANIESDLKSLDLMAYRDKCIDIQTDEFYLGKNKTPIKLRTLSYAILSKRIQEFDPRPHIKRTHNPIIDSRSTAKLYRWRIKGLAQPQTDSDDEQTFEYTRGKVRENPELRAIEDREMRLRKMRRKRKQPNREPEEYHL
jgi:hypothetical protein